MIFRVHIYVEYQDLENTILIQFYGQFWVYGSLLLHLCSLLCTLIPLICRINFKFFSNFKNFSNFRSKHLEKKIQKFSKISESKNFLSESNLLNHKIIAMNQNMMKKKSEYFKCRTFSTEIFQSESIFSLWVSFFNFFFAL